MLGAGVFRLGLTLLGALSVVSVAIALTTAGHKQETAVFHSGERLFLVEVGRPPILLAPMPQAYGTLSVSPRGETLAIGTSLGALSTEVSLVSTSDGQVRAVPGTREKECAYPAFTPDGQYLLAVCVQRDSSFHETGKSLDLFHLETGHVRTILSSADRKAQGLRDPFGPGGNPLAVSPDGRVAIINQRFGDNSQLLQRVDLATGDVTPFKVDGTEEFSVQVDAFLSDGRMIGTFCTDCAGANPRPRAAPRTQIGIFTIEGKVDAVLATVPGFVTSAALSDDGQTLLYSLPGEREFDPKLIAVDTRSGDRRQIARGAGATYSQPSVVLPAALRAAASVTSNTH